MKNHRFGGKCPINPYIIQMNNMQEEDMFMKISSFICCNDVKVEQDGQSKLLGPLQIFDLVNIPSAYSFTISIGLLDVKENDQFGVLIKNENGDTVKKIFPIVIPKFPDNIDETNPVGMQLNIEVKNLVFDSEGVHTFEVIGADGEQSLVTTYIRVQKVNKG